MGENILLANSTVDVEFLKKQSKMGSKIITLDYDTHRMLILNDIKHDASDTFLQEVELEQIQSHAYKLSNWSDEPLIKENICYMGVNIGKLFYIELYVFLLEFLKKFIEIQKICLKYSDRKFLVPDEYYDYVCMFSKNIENIASKETKQTFHYDSITFESKYYSIKLSYKKYLKIKNYLETISKIFLNTQINKDEIVLVEFNTIFYDGLFYKLKDHALFFGLRRPPVWSWSSFSIIRKSNSKLVPISKLLDHDVENKISNGIIVMKDAIDKLFVNDKFFASFFTINGFSIWQLIKPSLVNLLNRHLQEFVKNIEIIQKFFVKCKPRKILILSESGSTEQIMISKAKEVGIPIILLQHGNLHDNLNGHKYNRFTGSVIANSDQFLVWGDSMLKYANQYNLPVSKIHALGSPYHDKLFKKMNMSPKQNNMILLVTQGPLNMHVKDHTIKANEEYEELIKKTCIVAKKLNKKLIIKLHPYEDDNYEYDIAKKIDPSIQVLKKGNTVKLIQSCDLMISIGTSISSSIYDGHILHKPVLRIPFGEWFGKPDQSRPTSCYNISIDELENTIIKLSNEPQFRKDVLGIGQTFVDACLINQGNASQQITKFLLS